MRERLKDLKKLIPPPLAVFIISSCSQLSGPQQYVNLEQLARDPCLYKNDQEIITYGYLTFARLTDAQAQVLTRHFQNQRGNNIYPYIAHSEPSIYSPGVLSVTVAPQPLQEVRVASDAFRQRLEIKAKVEELDYPDNIHQCI